MNITMHIRELVIEARLAFSDRLEDMLCGRPRNAAKTRRLNKALDALAAQLDLDREGAAKYLLGNDYKWAL
jgi:hypothetical protein